MSCDILIVPTFLVVLEIVSSLVNQILDDKQLSISLKNIDMTIHLKDWYDVKDNNKTI